MQNVSVARRYAKALLDLAGANADSVLAQLDGLTAYFDANPEVWAAASSPALSRSQRSAVVDVVIKGTAGLDPSLANVLRLLTDRNRIHILENVARQLRDLVDARVGRVRGKVTSATKLSDAQLASLKASLEAMTSKKVLLDAKVDPSILGGVIAQVGSRTFDGSVRGQLDDMRQKLLAGR